MLNIDQLKKDYHDPLIIRRIIFAQKGKNKKEKYKRFLEIRKEFSKINEYHDIVKKWKGYGFLEHAKENTKIKTAIGFQIAHDYFTLKTFDSSIESAILPTIFRIFSLRENNLKFPNEIAINVYSIIDELEVYFYESIAGYRKMNFYQDIDIEAEVVCQFCNDYVFKY